MRAIFLGAGLSIIIILLLGQIASDYLGIAKILAAILIIFGLVLTYNSENENLHVLRQSVTISIELLENAKETLEAKRYETLGSK